MSCIPRRKHAKTSPLFPILLGLVCSLMLVGTVLFTVRLAKSNADDKTTDIDSGVRSGEQVTQDPSSEDEVLPTCLTRDSVNFVCLNETNASLKELTENILEITFSDNSKICVSTIAPEYISDKKLGALSATPFKENGNWYLPLSADGQLSADVEYSTFVSTAPAIEATLPDTLSAEQYFKGLTAKPELKTDPSAVEDSLNPGDTTDYLILANSTHSLGKDFVPENLKKVANKHARYSDEFHARLQEIAQISLDAFLDEAYANGYDDVTVTSGYRDYNDQSWRFQQKVNSLRPYYNTLEEAQNAAATSIQWPGKSEHQTGLACDMHNLGSASTDFQYEEAADWLRDNAYYFGFILRYPADKTDVTGISFEPWHFRYVGRYHATRMHLLDLTLEEYVEAFGYAEELA